MSINIAVILGSTRPGRAGESVANWFMEQTKTVSTKDATFTLIDLKDINLPMLDEPMPPIMHQYTNEHTKKWAETIGSYDGFVVITPEYNRGYPAVLKNAFDFINLEWNKKPIAFVSYGANSGGLRAAEQLRLVTLELQMAPIREQLSIPLIWEAAENNTIKPEKVLGNIEVLFKELIWWGKALKAAR
jgi:NAD(P)H-dependent FMN reductase